MKTLLLIEDEPDMVEVLFTILDSRDTRVLLALSGHEALEMLKQEPVDAVLTDVRMPEMSGIELVQRMRDLGFATPVVIMSGWADQQVILQAMRIGVLDVIEKPFVREKMVSTLKHALDLGASVRRIQDELKQVHGATADTRAHEMVRYLSVFLAKQELERAKQSSSVKSAA